MSYMCDVTGKKRLKGNRVSHANNKTTHFQRPNLHDRALFVPELGIKFKVRVSSAGLRTLDKRGGLTRFVLTTPTDKLSPNLRTLKKALLNR